MLYAALFKAFDHLIMDRTRKNDLSLSPGEVVTPSVREGFYIFLCDGEGEGKNVQGGKKSRVS